MMMLKYKFIRFSFLAMFLLATQGMQSQQITVDNIEDLLEYASQDNVDVKLKPKTYVIHTGMIGDDPGDLGNPMLPFTGSNNTFDFTGATILVYTEVFLRYNSSETVFELQILGNNNVLKNLTLVDFDRLDVAPLKSAVGIVMDGRDNRIEGFHYTVAGSYPYGYGDAFGKGGANTVIKHYKHSGILVRGLRNHLKNTTVISRSYGHCVFMQAASYPTIENCYIEGELRTTDDMLSGSVHPNSTQEAADAAVAVDFMTTWGYRLPPGYMMSLQEAGIRAYNAGTTYIDGEEIQRGTDNPTVLNCTMKNTRTGVALSHATGTSYVEGCTLIGCESGYGIGGGSIVDCGADALYGPIYKNAYASDRGYVSDITILAPSDEYYNGYSAVAYVGGYNHDLTFRSEETDFPSDLKIMIGGDLQGLRVLHGSNPSQNNHITHDVALTNLTNFPVVLASDSYDNVVKGCDASIITDNGSNNVVFALDCDSENLAIKGFATQISTDHGGVASRAIDGNTNGNYSANSVSHSLEVENPWWQVDMGTEQNISDIKIFNRTDSNGDRLSDFTVSVIDADGNVTFTQSYTTAPDPSIIVNAGGALGRVVKVQLNVVGVLSLAEVEVYGESLSVGDVDDELLEVYPNPIANELHVSLEGANVNLDSSVITLYDMNGQAVRKVNSLESNQITLDLSDINSGVYILHFSDANKSMKKKIIKL